MIKAKIMRSSKVTNDLSNMSSNNSSITTSKLRALINFGAICICMITFADAAFAGAGVLDKFGDATLNPLKEAFIKYWGHLMGLAAGGGFFIVQGDMKQKAQTVGTGVVVGSIVILGVIEGFLK